MIKKTFTFLFFLTATFATVFGQSTMAPDSTFGVFGFVSTGLKDAFANNFGNNFAITPDGKVICVGGKLVTVSGFTFFDQSARRLNLDGTVDPTFQFTSGFNSIIAPAVQADGKIILAWDSKISRFNPNGQKDSTFGVNGTVALGLFFSWCKNVLIQQDGKIIIYGTTTVNGDPYKYFGAARLLENGAFDPSFGLNGIIKYSFGGPFTLNIPVVMREYPNGQLMMAGSIFSNEVRETALLKLNANGTPDSTFGTFGFVHNGFKKHAECYGMDLMPDGKVVIGGYSTGSFAGNTLEALVARYDNNGQLDSGFYGVGIRYFSSPSVNTGLIHTDDQKIIFCGTRILDNQSVVYLGSILENGENDPSFGDSSVVVFPQFLGEPRAVQLAGDTTFFISGYVPDGNGDGDNFILKILKAPVITTGLWSAAAQLPTLIYPNPVIDMLRLDFQLPESGAVTIRMLDVNGALVHTWFAGQYYPAGENTVSLDFPPQVPAGTYVVHLSNGEKSVALQVIKSR